jgi:hypothetical protein
VQALDRHLRRRRGGQQCRARSTHGTAITKHRVYIADRNDNRIRGVDMGLP